jgi:hypothetical protein
MKLQHHDHTANPLFNSGMLPSEKTFKISGTPVEVLQALAYVRAFGGGHIRIGLGLLEAKTLYYKGQFATPDVKGRLSQEDYEIICSLVQNQKWVRSIEPWAGEIVDHDMDKVDYTTDMDNRFNMHPMDRFGKVMGLHWTQWQRIRLNSWLDIPAIPGRPTGKAVLVTGSGWQPREIYEGWRQQGLGAVSIFLGSPEEYKEWVDVTGITMTRQGYSHIGELAQWIEGMSQTICTPGWAPAIAQALNRGYMVQSLPEVEGWRNPYVLAERGNNSQF